VPNLIGPLFILVSMDIPSAIAIEAGLSFLGFGVRPPTPSWGTILNDGFAHTGNSPWIILAGGLPLVLSSLGFTVLGEGLRDAIDPRLRRRLRAGQVPLQREPPNSACPLHNEPAMRSDLLDELIRVLASQGHSVLITGFQERAADRS